MKGAVPGVNGWLSASPMDQMVVPGVGVPEASVQVKAAPPQACTSMPRWRWYQDRRLRER